MRNLTFAQAIEDALAAAMAADERVMVLGEDVHMLRRNLYARFGPRRVRPTPISEAAFVGAALGAAMAGLKPVAEVMLVDFITAATDALVNHAAKLEAFSGGKWQAPLVVRAACGGGYGDGGQHQQSLWGWLAHIPGLAVAVPCDPADAGGLMLSAIEHQGPVVYLEHKLLADDWLDYMGYGGRDTVEFDRPQAGVEGPVPDEWQPLPLGRAKLRREGGDISLVSLGVGVHRCLQAAERLAGEEISAAVLDLRWAAPLDQGALLKAAGESGRLLVVDEDYQGCGLSGELAALVLEAGISCRYARVCTQGTIPYARALEDETLPGTERILKAAHDLLDR